MHPTATVAGEVSGAWIGAGAVVAEGAEVHASVVLPGAVVAAGARVRDSIVGPRAVVGAGASLLGGSILGDDVELAPGVTLEGARLPEPAA